MKKKIIIVLLLTVINTSMITDASAQVFKGSKDITVKYEAVLSNGENVSPPGGYVELPSKDKDQDALPQTSERRITCLKLLGIVCCLITLFILKKSRKRSLNNEENI